MVLKYYLIGIGFFLILNQGCSSPQESDVAPSPIPDLVEPVIIINGSSSTSHPATETFSIAIPSSSSSTATPSTSSTATPSTSSTATPSTSSTATPSTSSTATPSTSSTATPSTSSTATPSTSSTATPSTPSTATPTSPTPITTAAPPAPTPIPDPEDATWVLRNNEENITCAVIHMALRMKIPYTANNKTEWGILNLAKNANISGNCDSTTLVKNITYAELSWDNYTSSLNVTFLRDDEKKTFNISQLILIQNSSWIPYPNNMKSKQLIFMGNASGLFSVESVPVGKSYKCSHKVNVNLTDSLNEDQPAAMLVFSKLQIQAFMNSTSTGFGSVLECPGLDASDIVPIAVGCALAGLVIGVLIAYLVGRRRSHVRGYLSM